MVLTNSGANKITVIRRVRELNGFGLGLKEAKDLVEHPPFVVLKGVEQAHAERARELLKTVGATVRLDMARTSETKDGGASESGGWVH